MYGYLFWTFVFGLIWFMLFMYRKDLRYEIIFSSILFAPFGLTQPLFVPEYWNPIVLFKIFNYFDIESILWCFFTGGIVAVLYEEIFKFRLKSAGNDKKSRIHAYIVYILMVLMILFMVYVKFFTNWSLLRSSFLVMIFIFIYFVFSRPDLFRKSIITGLVFLIFYIISLLFVDCIFLGFIDSQWTIQGSIGFKLFSIVIEEYIYAFLFGIVWSIVFEEIKNIKLKSFK